MRSFYSNLKVLLTCLMMTFIFTSTTAFAKEHSAAKEKVAEISWDKCCEQNNNDTAKCQGMQNVTDKKKNTGTKEKPNWVASSCPKAEPVAKPADAKPVAKPADAKLVAEPKKEMKEDKKK